MAKMFKPKTTKKKVDSKALKAGAFSGAAPTGDHASDKARSEAADRRAALKAHIPELLKSYADAAAAQDAKFGELGIVLPEPQPVEEAAADE